MIGLVLDTNVLVSAAMKRTGNEAFVLDLVTAGGEQICATETILSECADVRDWEPAAFPARWKSTRVVNARERLHTIRT